MRIAVAAYPIEWLNRWNDYVGKLRLWVRTAADGGAQLLVFPEFGAIELASLAEGDIARYPDRAIEALTARIKDVDALHASLAREFGVHICAASGPLRDHGGRAVNRARLFAPDGGRGVQDKLAPDAEERRVWGIEPGATAWVFDTTLGRIGVLIGADVVLPGLAAAMAHAGASVLLAPSATATAQAATDRRDAAQACADGAGRIVALAVALADADQAPALGPCTGTAAILGPGVPAVAEGKSAATGWVHAEASPAPDAAPAMERGAWSVEVTALVVPSNA